MIMAGALFTSATAFAQSKTDNTTGATTQKECCQVNGQQSDKVLKGKKQIKVNRPQFNPFDGVQLTDDQQQRLQLLQQGLGPVVLDKAQQAKIKENPNLTPEQKKQLKEERKNQKLESKKNYLKGVKEILTPDQYVVFLENVYLYSPDQLNNGVKDSKIGTMKQVKKGHHGEKSDKDKKARADKKNK